MKEVKEVKEEEIQLKEVKEEENEVNEEVKEELKVEVEELKEENEMKGEDVKLNSPNNLPRSEVVPDIKELTIKNLDTGEEYIIGENDPDFEFDTFPLTGDVGDVGGKFKITVFILIYF